MFGQLILAQFMHAHMNILAHMHAWTHVYTVKNSSTLKVHSMRVISYMVKC